MGSKICNTVQSLGEAKLILPPIYRPSQLKEKGPKDLLPNLKNIFKTPENLSKSCPQGSTCPIESLPNYVDESKIFSKFLVLMIQKHKFLQHINLINFGNIEVEVLKNQILYEAYEKQVIIKERIGEISMEQYLQEIDGKNNEFDMKELTEDQWRKEVHDRIKEQFLET